VIMGDRSIEDLRDELDHLMREHIESMKKQVYLGRDEAKFRDQEQRLKRIREVSADYLAALKRGLASEH
jgi:hypothetical protein